VTDTRRGGDHRKIGAGLALGAILLAGLAGGSHWHRAAKPRALAAYPPAAPPISSPSKPAPPPATANQWVANYGKLPLGFEANQGQTDSRVRFLSRGRGYRLFLTADEAVLELQSAGKGPRAGRRPPTPESVLRMKLIGANGGAAVTGSEELPGKSNYFIGDDPAKWRTNVPNYARVK
jgi:hypothetical protein